jgi:carboxylesterase type B
VLADELKAVVVAPNYRLNALGFLALSALSSQSDTGTSGNYGISDLIMALQWTHANIASFRGDPNAVTLLGQSSGATNIFALIANASNAPSLFRAAIALSGSANLSMSLATAEKQNAKYALAQSKCASGIDDFEIVSCLRGMSAEDANSLFTDDAYDTNVIAPCAAEGCSSPRNPFLYLGLPVVDGFVIKTSAMDAMQNLPKGFHTLLLQSTQGESEFKPDPTIDDAWSMEDFKQWMNNTFVGKLGYDENLFSQILDIHLKDVTLRTNLERYSALVSDPGATFPLLALARNVNGARVLVGYVRCPPSSPFPVSSNQSATIAFHMWDYVAATGSYNLFLQPPISAYGPFSPNLQDREFGRQIRSQWRSIVHGESTLPWSEFGVNENVGVIDCSLTSSVHMFRQDLEQLWRRIVKGPWEDYWWIN